MYLKYRKCPCDDDSKFCDKQVARPTEMKVKILSVPVLSL